MPTPEEIAKQAQGDCPKCGTKASLVFVGAYYKDPWHIHNRWRCSCCVLEGEARALIQFERHVYLGSDWRFDAVDR